MEKILIAGAHGTTGKHIVNLLQASRDYQPVAMVRKEEQEAFFREQGVTTRMADLEEDLDGVCQGVQKVIFAAGSGGKKVEAVDRDGAIKLMDEAKANGIAKFVMLSSMGTDQPEQGGDLEDYLRAKQQADAYLESSGLTYSIVRPGALTNEEGSHQVKAAASLNERGSIPREDVAETLVHALQDGLVDGKNFEILSGPTQTLHALQRLDAAPYQK